VEKSEEAALSLRARRGLLARETRGKSNMSVESVVHEEVQAAPEAERGHERERVEKSGGRGCHWRKQPALHVRRVPHSVGCCSDGDA
jgi:hypothetical protein